MNLTIRTYVATDPETPANVRSMARAWLNGELQGVIASDETPEGAKKKLDEFYAAEFEKHRNAKKRGRPAKVRVEGVVGAPEPEEIGEII